MEWTIQPGPDRHGLRKNLTETGPGRAGAPVSHSDDRMLDLCFFSQTRDVWRESKKTHGKQGGRDAPKPSLSV
jgi:hypothetical protein